MMPFVEFDDRDREATGGVSRVELFAQTCFYYIRKRNSVESLFFLDGTSRICVCRSSMSPVK